MLETFIPDPFTSLALTESQVNQAVEQLISPSLLADTKADFLTRLALKGETIDEITAFARALRRKAIEPSLDAETRSREILDVVGTGGDRLGTFNISTTAAIVCAAAGVTVAKHGNRAATSRCGSADVLQALGVPIDLTPDAAVRALREHGFAFFFAPSYHPAFKHVAAARKLCAQRGQRTIFNFLGPLLNPASPSAMLVGVPRPEMCEPLAHVLQSLGVRRGMVVCGEVPVKFSESDHNQAAGRETGQGVAYLDEFSTLGKNHIAEFYQERGFTTSSLSLEQFPLKPASLADLTGSDCEANAKLVHRLLAGEERGPKLDAVLLNAAAALFIAGCVRSLADGWELASQIIVTGRAKDKLDALTAITAS